MFGSEEYELLDFGEGRKLERFGPVVTDRPSPAAHERAVAAPQLWESANASFARTTADRGEWSFAQPLPAAWQIRHGQSTFTLRATEFGHVGVFPEQAANWDWIERYCREFDGTPTVLNLFAYTGGSTLAAAAAGAQVTHVDAARSTVLWARQNATVAGLVDAPVRWITEDARVFVRREIKRQRRYDLVILDPPSYGHSGTGKVWQIDGQLPELLTEVARLLPAGQAAMLLTCHSPGWDAARLQSVASEAVERGRYDGGAMTLTASHGAELDCGTWLRWTRDG